MVLHKNTLFFFLQTQIINQISVFFYSTVVLPKPGAIMGRQGTDDDYIQNINNVFRSYGLVIKVCHSLNNT